MKRLGFPIQNRSASSTRQTQTVATRVSLGLAALVLGLAGTLSLTNGVWADVVVNSGSSSGPVSQVPLSKNVVYVNPQIGTDTPEAGTEATPYRTITYALQQVQANTVIQLTSGSYTRQSGEVFPLEIKPGITLQGNEATKGQTVVIIGGGDYISPTFARQSVTIVANKNSEVSGVTITNPNKRGTGLWVESTNPVITNNTFSNSNRDGIFVTGTGNPKIEGNLFLKNSGNGISVARNAQGEIRGNVFQETGFGIAIGGSSTPRVVSNRISNNTDGIYVNDTARPILRNNAIEANARDGVVATVNAQPDLGTANDPGNNLVRNNGRFDLNNATRTATLLAFGNDIDQKRISGRVDFVAATVDPPGGSALRDIQGHWAQAYIEALAKQDIIKGFPDGTFRPTDPVTRAQFAAIVTKAFNPTQQRAGNDFADVPSNFWGYQAIQSAYQGGFLSGYPGGVFQPAQAIPRVQVLVSLANGLGLQPESLSFLSAYEDSGAIPSYAAGPVAAATQRGIVVNYPSVSQLNPTRQATRAEVAAFVYQALVSAGRAEAIPSPYIVRVPSTNSLSE